MKWPQKAIRTKTPHTHTRSQKQKHTCGDSDALLVIKNRRKDTERKTERESERESSLLQRREKRKTWKTITSMQYDLKQMQEGKQTQIRLYLHTYIHTYIHIYVYSYVVLWYTIICYVALHSNTIIYHTDTVLNHMMQN